MIALHWIGDPSVGSDLHLLSSGVVTGLPSLRVLVLSLLSSSSCGGVILRIFNLFPSGGFQTSFLSFCMALLLHSASLLAGQCTGVAGH